MPDAGPLGLYVHIPFCSGKCAYCDFASFPGRTGDIPRYLAALEAAGLAAAPSDVLILVDGPHKIKELPFRQEAVVEGDGKSLSIAAASIFAKVIRDRWMFYLDRRWPGYGFAGHKGYGTTTHVSSLNRLGPCPEHRRSFAPVRAVMGTPA